MRQEAFYTAQAANPRESQHAKLDAMVFREMAKRCTPEQIAQGVGAVSMAARAQVEQMAPAFC